MWDLRSQEWDCSVPVVGHATSPFPTRDKRVQAEAKKAEDVRAISSRTVRWRNCLTDRDVRDLVRDILRLVDSSRNELAPLGGGACQTNAALEQYHKGQLSVLRNLWEELGLHDLEARSLMEQEDHDERHRINPN